MLYSMRLRVVDAFTVGKGTQHQFAQQRGCFVTSGGISFQWRFMNDGLLGFSVIYTMTAFTIVQIPNSSAPTGVSETDIALSARPSDKITHHACLTHAPPPPDMMSNNVNNVK